MAKRIATRSNRKREDKTRGDGAVHPSIDDLDGDFTGIPEDFLRQEEAFWSWFDSPEGDLWRRMSKKLEALLIEVTVDARQRRFLWPGAEPKDLDQTIRRIRRHCPEFAAQAIKEFLAHWITALYEPEGYSESQMNTFEKLTAKWAEEINPGKN